MQDVTDRFLAEIRKSHTVLAYVDVTPPNKGTIRLTATDGSVSNDKSATIRRHLSMTCIDPTGALTKGDAEDYLAPYGTEVRPYRGVIYDDGTEEVVPLGVFRISDSSVVDKGNGAPEISIEGYDYSRTVQRDKFTAVYTVAKGVNIVTAIKAILARTFADLDYDAMTTTHTAPAPLVYDIDADPWQTCEDLATSMGAEIYFDADGDVVIAPPVDINHIPAPDWTFKEGPDCTMLDLTKRRTDEPGFNGVVLTGASPGTDKPPVRSVVWDNDPKSLTYHKGPYGEVPQAIQDDTVTTQAKADTAANAALAKVLGFSEQLTTTVMVNPALDVNDVVDVQRLESDVDGVYAIDSVPCPLKASGTSDLILRQKKVAE